jgi:hypothetical protein
MLKTDALLETVWKKKKKTENDRAERSKMTEKEKRLW